MLFQTLHCLCKSRTFVEMSVRKRRGSCDLARVHIDEADDKNKGTKTFRFFSFFYLNSMITSDTRRERRGQTSILAIYFETQVWMNWFEQIWYSHMYKWHILLFFPSCFFFPSLLRTSLLALCKCPFFIPHTSFSFFNRCSKIAPCRFNSLFLAFRCNLMHRININVFRQQPPQPLQKKHTPPQVSAARFHWSRLSRLDKTTGSRPSIGTCSSMSVCYFWLHICARDNAHASCTAFKRVCITRLRAFHHSELDRFASTQFALLLATGAVPTAALREGGISCKLVGAVRWPRTSEGKLT